MINDTKITKFNFADVFQFIYILKIKDLKENLIAYNRSDLFAKKSRKDKKSFCFQFKNEIISIYAIKEALLLILRFT